MHYKVPGGYYKSENAARSAEQKQADLLQILRAYPKCKKTLDYGCGKLRYFGELLDLSDTVYCLDSNEQLNRVQMIQGRPQSVTQVVKRTSNAKILLTEHRDKHSDTFDFILCANVLSAVPSQIVRLEILTDIKNLLNKKGTALIVLQYANSYFKDYSKRPRAHKIAGGYSFISGGQIRYYATIYPEMLMKMMSKADLEAISLIRKKGRLFCTCKRKDA